MELQEALPREVEILCCPPDDEEETSDTDGDEDECEWFEEDGGC